MPANELTISAELNPNLCSVLLGSGTEYNTGSRTFTNSVTWTAGIAAPTVIALPGTVPPCDWATIEVKFKGCTNALFSGNAGSSIDLYAPPPPSPTTTPTTYVVSPITVLPSLNVTFDTSEAKVSIHPPYVAFLSALNSFENNPLAGNKYEMDFIVKPFAGQFGLKHWSFNLSTGEKIVVVCNLVDPERQMSE